MLEEEANEQDNSLPVLSPENLEVLTREEPEEEGEEEI